MIYPSGPIRFKGVTDRILLGPGTFAGGRYAVGSATSGLGACPGVCMVFDIGKAGRLALAALEALLPMADLSLLRDNSNFTSRFSSFQDHKECQKIKKL